MKASSLRLLLPPLRLLTAAMWQVVQQQSVKHYGMLEEFVSLVTEAVPQLLTDRQRGLLLLALRTKVTLSDPADDQAHLERIHSVSEASDEDVTECCSALLNLTNKLTETPADSRRLLQEVFNQNFDSALQSLVSDFLSRIEQLFPVPDFRQAACWLHDAPCALEDSLQETHRKHLRELLTNQSCRLGQATTAVCGESEEALLSAWSHPLLTKRSHPDPANQSGSGAPRLDTDLVKVEVVVMMEDENEGVEEEAVVGQNMSEEKQEVSNQSSEGCGVTPVVEDGDRIKESPGDCDSQSEGSELTASPLHSVSDSCQRVAHRCPECGKCFIYRSQVIRHLHSNRTCGSAGKAGSGALQVQSESPEVDPCPPQPHPVRTHTCFQCSTIFKTRTELLFHQRTHQTRPVYKCNQCDRAFQHLSSLTNHKQTHLDKDGFACSKCSRTFESSNERDVHRLQHRLPDLSCSVCAQTFTSQTLLLRHLQTHSAQGAQCVYSCLFCDQSFSGVTQLRIHQRTHSFRSYQCDQCNKSYSSMTGLQSHRATHSTDSHFLCPQCGKRFKTRDGLEGHLRTHTGERPFRCPYCPKDFTALAGLNVHVRRHTGERPYVCTVCDKAWPSGGDLQKHMRTHTGERPYVCQECGKAFSISCHLTEHRRIHTGEKPYSCPECGKCLRRKFDLKKHLLSHSNVRPYACSSCSKSYTRQTHLNRHLLTHRTADRQQEKEVEPAEEA
ncbi:oocyte zinc finger protein XlCOF6-like isoform X2 [Girardinichthys multiradiatus]|uniref:oocyte zinc finger protein XlCOF6-like isoform X2 n=1 Tax=Girardinichthys multiradiatus TaxID=208333 RepID=UPI001FAD0323|nr:oocyte zinc finger protein XlCOF6-like isoform X2 [Girardinichthys multiradiatus]